MDTKKLIEDGLAKYQILHENAIRFSNQAGRYLELHSWLTTTQRLFPGLLEQTQEPDPALHDLLEEYREIHERAKNVFQETSNYRQLFGWLQQTRRVLPNFFTSDIPNPIETIKPFSDFEPDDSQSLVTRDSSSEALTALGGGVAAGIQAITSFQAGFSLGLQRQQNEKALLLVEEILRDLGTLHLHEIVVAMQERGYSGYPIDDTKNLYNALQARARANDRFRNEGKNRWSLIKSSQKVEL